MEEQELNTEANLNCKLAEWAGVEKQKIFAPDPMDYPEHRLKLIREFYPDFTQSLDVCFKWLVPKLVSGDLYIELCITADDTAVAIKRATSTVSFVCQPNPALAFCLAISQLIDREEYLLMLCQQCDYRRTNRFHHSCGKYPE